MTIRKGIRYIICRVKETSFRINYYFTNARKEITEKNLSTLKVISVGTLVLAVLLSLIAPKLVPGWVPTKEYLLMLPSLIAFIVFSFVYNGRSAHSYFIVQGVCLLFYVLMLYHLIDLSVFSYPSEPETYISCFFLLMPVLFILRPTVVLGIMFVAAVIFSELVLKYKVGVTTISHDRFATVASIAFSIVSMFMVFKLRLSDFYQREKYLIKSRTDLLTGLLNKRSYEKNCQLALRDKSFETPCALFVFDVDNFKEINDTYGHIIGDRALEIIGIVLSETFRSGDSVGRIGGDEFSALIMSAGNVDMLREKACGIQNDVTRVAKKQLNIDVCVSAGIAVRLVGNICYEPLFNVADRLLYNAKNPDNDSIQIKNV